MPKQGQETNAILRRSSRLQDVKFAGVIDEYVAESEDILNAADAGCTITDYWCGSFVSSSHLVVALVLTNESLRVFWVQRRFGRPKTWASTVALDDITEVSLTRESEVLVESNGEQTGKTYRWSLSFWTDGSPPVRDEGAADLWVHVINEAVAARRSADDARRSARLSIALDELNDVRNERA